MRRNPPEQRCPVEWVNFRQSARWPWQCPRPRSLDAGHRLEGAEAGRSEYVDHAIQFTGSDELGWGSTPHPLIRLDHEEMEHECIQFCFPRGVQQMREAGDRANGNAGSKLPGRKQARRSRLELDRDEAALCHQLVEPLARYIQASPDDGCTERRPGKVGLVCKAALQIASPCLGQRPAAIFFISRWLDERVNQWGKLGQRSLQDRVDDTSK